MKTRIMTRAQIARLIIADRDRKPDDDRPRGDRERAMHDMTLHILAAANTDDTIKIYNDVPMGGFVIEIKE